MKCPKCDGVGFVPTNVFGINGAIFSYEETGGKKIRRGDCISTQKNYYFVTRGNLPPYKEIDYSMIGTLKIGNDTYRVLRVRITSSVNDKATFSAISIYLKKYYGVWLLECQPELIPIWPPVVQREYCIPVNNYNNVVCAVSSGNIDPNVYVYSEYSVKKISVQHDYGEVSTVNIVLGNRPIVLSVDRKYVGREITFHCSQLQWGGYKYNLGIKNLDDIIPFDAFDFEEASNNLLFVANGKMELYIGTGTKAFRNVSVRDLLTPVSVEGTIESTQK